MKRAAVVVLLVVVMGLMVGSASAGQPEAASRFWLASYDPPRFSVQAQLVESQTDVTIKYGESGFSVGFSSVQICAPGTLSADDMTVLSAALDYAVQTAKAMPE
jgi:hypothetical protein